MYSGPSFVKSYEVSLFIGSFNNETQENFTKNDLIERIAEFQNDPRIALCEEDDDLTSVKHPVRVTDTEFVSVQRARLASYSHTVPTFSVRRV